MNHDSGDFNFNFNSDGNGFQYPNYEFSGNTGAEQPSQSQLNQSQFDQPFLDDLDTFGLTPDINIIGDHENANDDASTTTPSHNFDQTTFIDINSGLSPEAQLQQQQQQARGQNQNTRKGSGQDGSGNLPPESFQSQYATSYNNLNFNNNGAGANLNNLISPNEYSDFDNSPYGSSFQPDSLKSPPMNSPTFSPSSLSSTTKHMSKEEKLRRRREFHNAVERRRRDLIKDRIKELGALIPPSLLFEIQFNKEGKEITKESRANKSIILNKTVDYIVNLQAILASQDERLEFLKQKIEELSG